ncbi:hypothetical protein KKF91_19485 [Myxococcota bacterium]|nr:hypothetical protein [Myxococcota bacterium]MBU1432729.1 hypothetical protein [Myxococcota bacterium]MBU1900362.1 hypothetical protein [Myxococcota bacterium]
MSNYGTYQVELERQRQEQLRIQQLSGQLNAQMEQARLALGAVLAPEVEARLKAQRAQLLAQLPKAMQTWETRAVIIAGLEKAVAQAQAVAGQWQRAVVQAKAEIEAEARAKAEAEALAKAEAEALAKAEAEARAKAEAEAEIEAVAPRLAVMQSPLSATAAEQAKLAQAALERGRAAAAVGDVAGAVAAAAAIEAAATAFDAAEQQEMVRRETVTGLVKILSSMGFIAARPKRRAEDDVVILEGQLPSGRRARFEVEASGVLSFDLNGYPGRDCKADLDHVSAEMTQRFGVQLKPLQFNWSNPDRDLKEARSTPQGGGAQRGERLP